MRGHRFDNCIPRKPAGAATGNFREEAGDALLRAAADRLKAAARSHFVARLGGDEFVVLQTMQSERNAVHRLAESLIEAIGRPLIVEGTQLIPSTSIGIALAPADGTDAGALLKNADLALDRAKEAGRGTYAFFEVWRKRRSLTSSAPMAAHPSRDSSSLSRCPSVRFGDYS